MLGRIPRNAESRTIANEAIFGLTLMEIFKLLKMPIETHGDRETFDLFKYDVSQTRDYNNMTTTYYWWEK